MTTNRRRFTLVVVGTLLVGNAAGIDAQPRTPADQSAAAAAASAHKRAGGGSTDDDWHPLREPERQTRQKALQERLKQGGSGRTHRTANGQYVELERQGETKLWVVPGEFGTQVHPSFGGAPGPLHNGIAEPDRSVDTMTVWHPDFDHNHYRSLFFSDAPGARSLRNYYVEVSSNRYTPSGDVTGWVQVPFNVTRYGQSSCPAGALCARSTQFFIQDSVNAWYAAEIAAGRTAADIDAYLSQFDVWDRFDYDGDGNFDEADGYIDAFQSVHAGAAYEDNGGPEQIWSHASYAFFNRTSGPPFNRLGGARIGSSSYWIGNYSIVPENGAVPVIAHEYAHATLGLPDLYDRFSNLSTSGYWTLMSAGAFALDGVNGNGLSGVTHLGAWEKLQLGWLDYETARAGEKSSHKLGPSITTTKQAQAIFVELPDKVIDVPLGPPYAGAHFYHSGMGDLLNNFMYREVTLPAGAQLTAQVRYQNELDFDYAYVVVSVDGGATWTPVATNRSSATNPFGSNFGHGITGSTGGAWVSLTADLSAFVGPVLVGFRYWTDLLVTEPGFMIDDIAITGQPVDGAEPGSPSWHFVPADGFRISQGSFGETHFHAYLAEFRQYRGFDSNLRNGPVIWTRLDVPLWSYLEPYPYQQGLLVTYWDTSQADNNSTSIHPGRGLILPVDAHPEPLTWLGYFWGAAIQSSDSPFGLTPTDRLTLTNFGIPDATGGYPAVPVFDDTLSYWNPAVPWIGVDNPHTGTIIEVKSVSAQGTFMEVEVRGAEGKVKK